jgi:arginine:agmatine antiporter
VAIAVGAVGYLSVFFPALVAPLLGLGALQAVMWATTAANLAGPRLVASLSGVLLVLGLAPIVAAIALGFAHFDPALFKASWNISGKPAHTVLPALLAPIFWAFLGLESANVAAAVVDHPRRNLPIAALGGVALASAVYMAALAAMFGVLPARTLAASPAPFAAVIASLAGPAAGALVAACALLKTSGTLAGFILVTAESGRAGAASGFLPRALSVVDPDRPPVRDTLVVAVLMSLTAFATLSPTLGEQFNRLTTISVVFYMAVYALCALALVVAAKDFAGTGPRWIARVVGVLALAVSVTVMAASDKAITLPAFVLLGAAIPIWLATRLYARVRPQPVTP